MASIWRGGLVALALFASTCLVALVLFSSTTAAGANAIEAATDEVREEQEQMLGATASDPDGLLGTKGMERLAVAIRRGEQASGRLRQQIETLEDQKASLERVQTVLTSGLIGALVTAAVALFGVFGNLRRSRAERDLRRLEVIEKAHLLHQQGVPLPDEFLRWLPEHGEAAPPSGQ